MHPDTTRLVNHRITPNPNLISNQNPAPPSVCQDVISRCPFLLFQENALKEAAQGDHRLRPHYAGLPARARQLDKVTGHCELGCQGGAQEGEKDDSLNSTQTRVAGTLVTPLLISSCGYCTKPQRDVSFVCQASLCRVYSVTQGLEQTSCPLHQTIASLVFLIPVNGHPSNCSAQMP